MLREITLFWQGGHLESLVLRAESAHWVVPQPSVFGVRTRARKVGLPD